MLGGALYGMFWPRGALGLASSSKATNKGEISWTRPEIGRLGIKSLFFSNF